MGSSSVRTAISSSFPVGSGNECPICAWVRTKHVRHTLQTYAGAIVYFAQRVRMCARSYRKGVANGCCGTYHLQLGTNIVKYPLVVAI